MECKRQQRKSHATLIIKTDSIADLVAKLVVKGYNTTDISDTRMQQIKEIYKDDTGQLLPSNILLKVGS